MPNQKKRQGRTGGPDEEQVMFKRLQSSSEGVEVVQLASDCVTPTDPKTDPIMSSRSDGNKQKAQVTPSHTEIIYFDKVMAQSELITQVGPSHTFPNTLPEPQQTFPGGEETL